VQQFTSNGATGFNLIADWPGGDTNNILMSGGHLDSVTAGPGINDNGSGSAGLLEVALEARAGPDQGLPELRHDRLAQTPATSSTAAAASPPAPSTCNVPWKPTSPASACPSSSPRSVAAPITPRSPVPASPPGGLFTGAEGIKTAAQAQKWGGSSGVAYDRCYHRSCDTSSNINTTALDRNSDAVATAIWSLAGTGTPPTGPRFENPTDVAIPDLSTVESPITVTGVPGNAPAALAVGVDIRHTFRGDLVVDVLAPDGTAYNISNRSGGSWSVQF
jgi:aminopeptidase S